MDKDEQKRLWKQRLDGYKEVRRRELEEVMGMSPAERLQIALDLSSRALATWGEACRASPDEYLWRERLIQSFEASTRG